MIRLLYSFLIYLYKLGIFIASPFSQKASYKWKGIKESTEKVKKHKERNDSHTLFIHCASQGEHEQAKPIIRWVLENTMYNIILSFSSPSGYRNTNSLKNERLSKIYLPFDTPSAMSSLLDAIQPIKTIIIKNEWWWNMIHAHKQRSIPVYLISATFRSNHYFVKWPFKFFKEGLNVFDVLFVNENSSKSIISKITKSKILTVGDTRIDQVNYIKQEDSNREEFNENIINPSSTRTIVYGSIWTEDIPSILSIIEHFPDAVHLIYPHHLSDSNIHKMNVGLPIDQIIEQTKDYKKGVNLITSMGELKYAYRMASVAYIGGGFGEGIHNILEAAVYTIPTIFGPNNQKSSEANDLIGKGCAFEHSKPADLTTVLKKIEEEKTRKSIETNLKSYFSPQFSPTELICQEIFQNPN